MEPLLHSAYIVFFTVFGAAVRFFITEKEAEKPEPKKIIFDMFSASFVGAMLVSLISYYDVHADLQMPAAGAIGFVHKEFLQMISKAILNRIGKYIEKVGGPSTGGAVDTVKRTGQSRPPTPPPDAMT